MLDVFRCGCGRFVRFDAESPSVRRCPGCGRTVSDEGAPQSVGEEALEGAVRLAPVPLLVEFWAPDCEPCLTSAVVVDAVAHRIAGEAVVLRLDVEENPLASEAYGILAVPTLVLFSGGQERGRRIGAPRARELQAWIRAAGQPEADA